MRARRSAGHRWRSNRGCWRARSLATVAAPSAARSATSETRAARRRRRGRARRQWPGSPQSEAPGHACAASHTEVYGETLARPWGKSIQCCMVRGMGDRLTAQDWIDFALTTLAREGADALKADVLARALGVSRGSFYWHFSDLAAFHACVIERWKQTATEAIIADLERYGSSEARVEALARQGFGHDTVLEIRMRSWADTNAEAARAL